MLIWQMVGDWHVEFSLDLGQWMIGVNCGKIGWRIGGSYYANVFIGPLRFGVWKDQYPSRKPPAWRTA